MTALPTLKQALEEIETKYGLPNRKWSNSERLCALVTAWNGDKVECPICGGICELYGDVFNTQIWCSYCKTGCRSGV